MKTMKTKTKYQDGGANGKGKLGPALGIGTTVSSAAGLITKMIVDKVKAKKAAKAEEEKKKAVEAAKKMTMKKMGGAAKYKMGGAKKYQPGGPTQQEPIYQGPLNENVVKKLEKAHPLATGPRVYDRDVADEVDNKQMREDYYRIPAQKRGGATKKYMTGGMKKPLRKANNGTTVGSTTTPAGPRDPKMVPGISSPTGPYSTSTPTMGGKPLTPAEVAALNKQANIKRLTGRKYGGAKTKFMTGGMVNSNAKVSALKSAGSNGVKSGVNPKAKASTTTKGKTGGTSKAPTKATPTKNKRK